MSYVKGPEAAAVATSSSPSLSSVAHTTALVAKQFPNNFFYDRKASIHS